MKIISIAVFFFCVVACKNNNKGKISNDETFNPTYCELLDSTLNFSKLNPFLFQKDQTYFYTVKETYPIQECAPKFKSSNFIYVPVDSVKNVAYKNKSIIEFSEINIWPKFAYVKFEIKAANMLFNGVVVKKEGRYEFEYWGLSQE
jgi:hypothetical protein